METAELLSELEYLINNARQEISESSGLAPNSYGAGYDSGFLDALIRVQNLLTGKDE